VEDDRTGAAAGRTRRQAVEHPGLPTRHRRTERLSLRTLVALCDIFDCSPADLIEPYVESASRKKTAGESTVVDIHRDFRPERARIVHDE